MPKKSREPELYQCVCGEHNFIAIAVFGGEPDTSQKPSGYVLRCRGGHDQKISVVPFPERRK